MSNEVAVVARMTATSGRREELVAACRAAVSAARDEPGTLEYRLHVDGSDPDVVWFYERYQDRSAFDEHMGSERMRTFGRSVSDLLAGRPDLTFLTPVTEA